MTSNNKPMQINQNKESKDDQKNDKIEEMERKLAVQQLEEFDAHGFYDRLTGWSARPVDSKSKSSLPISRAELSDLRRLSKKSLQLLQLLRAIDHKGIECPYIHTVNKKNIEYAAKKCQAMTQAASEFRSAGGMVSKLKKLLHFLHLSRATREIEYFKGRLEALLLFCRHQEFSRELSQLSRSMSYQSLEPKPEEKKSLAPKREKGPRVPSFGRK